MSYTYPYQMVSVATDLIVICDRDVFTPAEDKILLIKRGGEPYKDSYALPGGFVEVNELPLDAAKRELMEETNIDVDKENLVFVKMADKVDRDPRQRTYSYVYDVFITEEQAAQAKAGDDAAALEWFDVKDIIEHKIPLAFDHQEILDEYFEPWGYTSYC